MYDEKDLRGLQNNSSANDNGEDFDRDTRSAASENANEGRTGYEGRGYEGTPAGGSYQGSQSAAGGYQGGGQPMGGSQPSGYDSQYSQPALGTSQGSQAADSQPMSGGQSMSGQPMSGQPMSGGQPSGYDSQYSQSAFGASQGSQAADSGQPMNGGQYGQYNRSGYQSHQETAGSHREVNRSYIPEDKPKKKKKGGFAKRAAAVVAAGICFGAIAGGTMFGVNYVANEHFGTENETTAPQVQTSETLATPTVAPTNSVAPILDVSAIVDEAMPSVVAITSTVIYENPNYWSFFFGGGQQSQTYEVPSSGSGIIVGQNDEELLIVTNNHVVEDASTLKVTFIDESTLDATIKGTDADSDLAVISIPLSTIPEATLNAIKIATLGDSDEVKVGQGVIAIGNALGYGQSVTVGYVSALNREVKTEQNGATRTLLQTDAAINPGNSGGALLNTKGEVIGINAAKYSDTSVEGMGYAIPISYAYDIIDELMNRKTRVEVAEDKKGYLGIQGNNVDSQMTALYGIPQGAYVYKITENSPAANSDLREKDIITKVDGEKIKTYADLQTTLGYYEGGSTITLTVQSLENGAYVEREVQVTLGYRKDYVDSTNQAVPNGGTNGQGQK